MNPDGSDISVLLIEDNNIDALLIQRALSNEERERFAVRHVRSLSEGNKCLLEMPADVVLLDLSLPDSSGKNTFRHIHSNLHK